MSKHQTPPRADKEPNPFTQVRDYLTNSVTFPNPVQADICALWILGTHIYKSFDAFGYLCITASTKRAGKSVLAEVMSQIARDGKLGTSMTASILRRLVSRGCTLFFDEAESLNSEAASSVREYLNVGYRAGQSVFMPGDGPDEVVEYPAYGPKCFILIGDVNDTLRDRSITIELRRAPAPKIYKRTETERESKAILGEKDSDGIAHLTHTIERMTANKVLTYDEAYDFLDSRTAEVWSPILALAKVFAPDHLDDLIRFAADTDAIKQTTEKASFRELRTSAESAVTDDAFRVRAMQDLGVVMDGEPLNVIGIHAEVAVEKMKAIPTSPWRAYKGTGLTVYHLADLVNLFVAPSTQIKIKGKNARGYRRDAINKGLRKIGPHNPAPEKE